MSEAGLNGRVAGYYHVPVAFISGDQNAVRCAKEELFEPVELEVTFTISDMAAMTELIPGVTRKSARTVVYTGRDYLESFKVFRAMLVLTDGIK